MHVYGWQVLSYCLTSGILLDDCMQYQESKEFGGGKKTASKFIKHALAWTVNRQKENLSAYCRRESRHSLNCATEAV